MLGRAKYFGDIREEKAYRCSLDLGTGNPCKGEEAMWQRAERCWRNKCRLVFQEVLMGGKANRRQVPNSGRDTLGGLGGEPRENEDLGIIGHGQ